MGIWFVIITITMGVTPNSWMVYSIVDNPIKMDENWGYPNFRKPPFGKNKSSNQAIVSIVANRSGLREKAQENLDSWASQ